MLFIEKGNAPQVLVDNVEKLSKVDYADPCYKNLSTEVKRGVLQSLLREQGYLCAYCMQEIDIVEGTMTKAHIEHYHPQNPSKRYQETLGRFYDKDSMSVDYRNMLAVCDGGERSRCPERTCDKSRSNDKPLTVDPTNRETIDLIIYREDGSISSDNDAIRADLEDELNLNSPAFSLARQRKDQIAELNKVIYAIQDAHGNPDKQGILSFCIRVQTTLSECDGRKKPRFAGIILWHVEKLICQFSSEGS